MLEIGAQARKQGIDYLGKGPGGEGRDLKAVRQFDVALNMLMATNDEGLSIRQLAKQAHATVLATRGIAAAREPAKPAKAAAPTPPPGKPPARDNAKPPLTLRAVPVAATPSAGNSLVDSFRGKAGAEFDRAYGQLSDREKAVLRGDLD
jgi:hypothetical protein